MYNNYGKNKISNDKSKNKFEFSKNVSNLSLKNAKQAKQKNPNNKIPNNKFPKKSYEYEEKNKTDEYPLYPNLSSSKKSKLSQSVNVNYDYNNNYNKYYNKDNTTKKKTIQSNSKRSLNRTNNQFLKNKETEKKQKEREKAEKERQRLIEEEKERKEIERLLIEKIERERREKEFLEREKEKERQLLKLREEEKEKEKKKQKEKEEKERIEKEKKEKEEKEKKKKEEKEKKEKKEKEKKELDKLNEYKKSNQTSNIEREEEKEENISSEISSVTKSKIGLRNLGNTCFMNTCLQNLIHSEFFIVKLFAKSFLISSKAKISKQFYSLCKDVSSCVSTACSPDDFKSAFGSKHSMFSGYAQHDTQEFCRILLEDMNSELNEVLHPAPYKELSTLNKSKIECNKEFDEVFRKRENSLIMDVFYGQLINIFKCDCDFETYSFEKILDLPLLLPKQKSSIDIKDLLEDYFDSERIKFETKCEKCKKKEWHTKVIKISQPPNILILSLQRQNPRTGTKNNSNVYFSDELDMSVYLDHECWNKNDAKYSLYGIGNHSGSINFGHYYAYIKINNSWYNFNDSSVSPHSKGENNSSSEAYILFYKKKSI